MVESFHLLSPLAQQWFADSPLSASDDTYVCYLNERGYAAGTITGYVNCVAHFAYWLKTQEADLTDINNALLKRFIDEHLPVCRCAARCRRARHELQAALGHLLTMLYPKEHRVQAGSVPVPTAVAAELERFDRHLEEVRGLALSTRSTRFRHLRDFLIYCFGSSPIHLKVLGAADVMRFTNHYTVGWVPASIRAVTISLRSYFAFRASQGEYTSALIAALPQVAQWSLATLPPVLSSTEIEQLLSAFDHQHATSKRDYAIARCLLDLGLRRTEVSRLCLGKR